MKIYVNFFSWATHSTSVCVFDDYQKMLENSKSHPTMKFLEIEFSENDLKPVNDKKES